MWGNFGIIPTVNQFYHYNELYHDNIDQHRPFSGDVLKVIFPIAWAAVGEEIPMIPQFVVH